MLRIACLMLLCLTASAPAAQNVVVLLDDSGSMNDSMGWSWSVHKIDAAKRALLTVLDQVPPGAQVGVLVLNGANGQGGWIIPLGPVDKTQVKRAIEPITAGGGTLLGAFMKTAADALLARREKEPYGDFRLLIVTDGEANDQPVVEAYLPEILARGIQVDVIGVDMEDDHSLATRVHNYRRADDPATLAQAIRESLAESSLDGNDPDQASDFELLAGLPDEMATAVIQQLCRVDNRPIGSGDSERDGDLTANEGQSPFPPPGTFPASRRPARPFGSIAIGLVIFIVCVMAQLLKQRRRNR